MCEEDEMNDKENRHNRGKNLSTKHRYNCVTDLFKDTV